MFDIREGEGWRVTFMALYMILVLFAYYIIKPVSRGMFLAKFDIDDRPYLYILIAFAGGAMAYAYTKIFIRVSLKAAVTAATVFMAGTLTLIWWLLAFQWPWMLYFFNAFVSLFSITLVSQGWMVASNLFSTREAKRLYPLLGLGAVVGAAFGGSFTAIVVHYTGTRNLLLVSVLLVVLAYGCFLAVLRTRGVSLAGARGAEAEESFAISDVL
jgi:AAA family ATP:ADP antiporter